MANPYWSDWGGALLLNYILINQPHLWVGAHSADPTPAGILSTELAGGGYARDKVTFTSPSGRNSVNSTGFGWDSLPGSVIRYFALWTAITGPQLILVHPLPNAISIPASGHASVAKGDWAIGV